MYVTGNVSPFEIFVLCIVNFNYQTSKEENQLEKNLQRRPLGPVRVSRSYAAKGTLASQLFSEDSGRLRKPSLQVTGHGKSTISGAEKMGKGKKKLEMAENREKHEEQSTMSNKQVEILPVSYSSSPTAVFGHKSQVSGAGDPALPMWQPSAAFNYKFFNNVSSPLERNGLYSPQTGNVLQRNSKTYPEDASLGEDANGTLTTDMANPKTKIILLHPNNSAPRQKMFGYIFIERQR